MSRLRCQRTYGAREPSLLRIDRARFSASRQYLGEQVAEQRDPGIAGFSGVAMPVQRKIRGAIRGRPNRAENLDLCLAACEQHAL